MAFKKLNTLQVFSGSPEELFHDFRARKVEGMLSQQADILREYLKYEDQQDVALELPTGSGKTLVGLLIAEWRRRKYQESALFLCPTVQLVNQVAEQARNKYGIDVLTFSGSKHSFTQADKSRFLNNEMMGVATYSTLFNSNPIFDNLSTVVFDDAHSAENYISKPWSLEINEQNNEELFDSVKSLLKPYIARGAIEDNNYNPIVSKLPFPHFLELMAPLTESLDKIDASLGDIFFNWKILRENLFACHLYYTPSNILIRPYISSTFAFAPFHNIKHRIYMSATLGEGGELERIFGCKKIQRVPSPDGWEKQGIGRRFFAFPMRNFEEAEALELANKWIDKPKGSNHRCLILTQSKRECLKVKEDIKKESFSDAYKFVNAGFIESSKKEFIETDKAIALLANRYDGIDFLADDCRYLILYGLPDAANLQERFLIERLNSKVLLKVRILTKITQAVGRCTRSATDWSLVTVIGQNINNYFMKSENRKYFHPELQAEIEFGIEQSDVSCVNEFSDNIDLFLNQSREWREAENDIIDLRSSLAKEKLPCTDILEEIVSFEIKYQEYLWSSDFEKAVDEAAKVIAKLNGEELRGYRAWWLYLAGNAAYLASNHNKAFQATAVSFYENAAKAAKTLSWLKKLTEIFRNESNNITQNLELSKLSVIDRLEQKLNNLYGLNRKKFNTCKNEILEGLSDNSSADNYERAQKKLGDILGYQSFTPEKKEQGAPDCWWILDQKNGLVFEDNNEASNTGEISKDKALQSLGHIKYLKEKHPDIDFSVVVCSSKSKISDCALVHVRNENIYYISSMTMQEFAKKALNSIEKLNTSFVEIGNNDWRNNAIEVYQRNKLFPIDVLDEFRSMPLVKLNESKKYEPQQENAYT